MDSNSLEEVDGSVAGQWIAEMTHGGPGPLVREQIPQCYDGYLRLFHPATTPQGAPISWLEVSRMMGSTFHPLAQWKCLARARTGAPRDDREWRGSPPVLGELSITRLDVLCIFLSNFSKSLCTCFFGLSTILSVNSAAVQVKRPLTLGGIREFAIVKGPLSAAGNLDVSGALDNVSEDDGSTIGLLPEDDLLESAPPGFNIEGGQGDPAAGFRHVPESELAYLTGGSGQPPNLIWPADRSWFVASEVDFDSTLVGGSASLIAALDLDDRIETQIVDASDSLAADADVINCPPV